MVIVGPGPMGIIAVQYAKICGAKRVFLIGLRSDEMRLQIGKQVGADYVLAVGGLVLWSSVNG